MKISQVYDYQYDNLSEILSIEFSLKGDDSESYRTIELEYDEIIESIPNPLVLEEYDIEELLEEEDFVIEILEIYLSYNDDSLPEEQYM